MLINSRKNYWAVIPAAGVGKRMGTQIPKQYLPLAGKTVIEHTLAVFLQHPAINGIVIAITPGDPYWQDISTRIKSNKSIITVAGGKERCYSVLNALIKLSNQIDEDDDCWTLVHDAARPCLETRDIDYLMEQLSDSEVGGLLGLPMADTVKRCNQQKKVLETVERSDLWRALTPQMFPLKILQNALEQAIEQQALVTDEASAIELQGLQPTIVEGQPGNIKITHPGDLQLAELFFSQSNT